MDVNLPDYTDFFGILSFKFEEQASRLYLADIYYLLQP
jgi:hypothetical protein